MAKKITKPMVVGGILGVIVHFIWYHQGDFQTLFPVGAHTVDGIAFTLAGAFIGWYLAK